MALETTVAPPSPQCFACGADNASGLHLVFTRDPDGACRAELMTRTDHVGWPDTIHGGILFTIMDEAAAWALTFAGLRGVTAKAEVRFRLPVRAGARVVVTGRVLQRVRKTARVEAELREAGDGAKLLAELDAVMVVMD